MKNINIYRFIKKSRLIFALLPGIYATAQTYPGGVSSSAMAVWLRAETGWTAASWTNQAPAGSRAFTAIGLVSGNTSPSPVLNAAVANFNFNPAVKFQGRGYSQTSAFSAITPFYSSATSNSAQVTYFAASDIVGGDILSNIYSDNTISPCGGGRCNTGFRYNSMQFANSTASVSVTYPTTGANNIGAGRRVSDANRSGFMNGIETNQTSSSTLSNLGPYSFDVGCWGFNTYNLNGPSIPEIIWYKTALNSSEMNKVNSYLAFKYGVTLNTSASAAQNYTASDGTVFWNAAKATVAYRYNIFGLGRDDNSAGVHQRVSHSVNNSGSTTTGGQYLIVSTNNNFTNLNTTANHPDIPNNLTFIMYSDNGGDYTNYSTDFSSPSINGTGKRSGRIWMSQDTGGLGTLNYQFNSIPGGHSYYYVVKADDASFTTNASVIPITVTAGTAVVQMDLNKQGVNNGVSYFTIVVSDVPLCNAGNAAPKLTAATITSNTADLSAMVTGTPPNGTTMQWHTTATPADISTLLPGTTVTATTTPTNYYVVYYDSIGNCYSPSAKVTVVSNSCPAATVDLTALPHSSIPANTTLVWYKDAPRENGGTLVTAPNAVENGTYWPYFYDADNTCYSPVGTPVVVGLTVCNAPCYKPGITAGTALDTKMGITALGRAGAEHADNWPMLRKGGWIAMEAQTKGFVPNRVAFDGLGNPVGIATANFVEGMMVYDTTNKCIKVYTLKEGDASMAWHCMTTQTCPD